MNNDTSTQTVGQRIAAQFFNPQVAHGSHPRLAAAIDDAVKPLVDLVKEFEAFQISTYSQKERAQQWLKMKRKAREALKPYTGGGE